MNNGIKVGLSNIQVSIDGETYKPLKPAKEVILRFEEPKPINNELNFDITQPIEMSIRLRKKKKGTIIERCLYYQHNRKKRIRKKYCLWRILGDKE